MSDCFIIMPITTPADEHDNYRGGPNHFTYVLEQLFTPALIEADMKPIPPQATGSEVIEAAIINNLEMSELVLCDMSTLNPNVFFELGIRTALNKPVALVVDERTSSIPFDINHVNYHTYDSGLNIWDIKKQRDDLVRHIKSIKAVINVDNCNPLWKNFGGHQKKSFEPLIQRGEIMNIIYDVLNKEKESEKQTNLQGYAQVIPPRKQGGIEPAQLVEEIRQRIDAIWDDGVS